MPAFECPACGSEQARWAYASGDVYHFQCRDCGTVATGYYETEQEEAA